jgi:hypothetical protein
VHSGWFAEKIGIYFIFSNIKTAKPKYDNKHQDSTLGSNIQGDYEHGHNIEP